MIKDILKELDIKISELAEYFNATRPTIYKYIGKYDEGNTKGIPSKIKQTFDYISNNTLIDKHNVISFIFKVFNDNTDDYENSNIALINNFLKKNINSEKGQFISKIVSSSSFDLIIHYAIQISELINKEKLSKEELKLLKPYQEIEKIYSLTGGKIK